MEKKIMDINLNHLSKEQKAKLVNDVLNDYEAFKAITTIIKEVLNNNKN